MQAFISQNFTWKRQMYLPIKYHCDNKIVSPTLDAVQQKHKGMPDQQHFDKCLN